jgi:hypothetical protein
MIAINFSQICAWKNNYMVKLQPFLHMIYWPAWSINGENLLLLLYDGKDSSSFIIVFEIMTDSRWFGHLPILIALVHDQPGLTPQNNSHRAKVKHDIRKIHTYPCKSTSLQANCKIACLKINQQHPFSAALVKH